MAAARSRISRSDRLLNRIFQQSDSLRKSTKGSEPLSIAFQDYYETLGVARTATQEEISKAFRRLARKYHPDVNKAPGAEDQFKKINEANEVLSDPQKRSRYDELGANWKAGQEFQPPPGWEEILKQFGGAGASGTAFQGRAGPRAAKPTFHFGGGSGFSDFFDVLFGAGDGRMGGARARGGRPSPMMMDDDDAPRSATVTLSLEEAFQGTTKVLNVPSTKLNDQGLAEFDAKHYRIKIPPGTTDGKVIRVLKKGTRDTAVFLTIRIAPHAQFRLEGENVIANLSLSPWEAALGTKANVVTLDGTVQLTIPAGSQSGQRLRLRGKGFGRREQRGDMFVELRIVVPKQLTDKERELFQQLAATSNFRPRE